MRTFIEELAVWGPDGAGVTLPLPEAEAYTRRLAGTHYENFPVLSWCLPARLRQHFANLYAYCRWADDLADEVGDPPRSLALLDWWEEQLECCYAGRPRHPVMVALARTIAEFSIPRQPFADLVTAFRRDQVQTRYETFTELCDYCRCSADPVGRLVLHVCGTYNEQNARLADAICTGLQLANFWQDVGRDADKGRIYLPREDLQSCGVPERQVLDKQFSADFAALLAIEVARAEQRLRRGLPLAVRMPGRLKMVIAGFAQGGLGVLRKVRAFGYNVFRRRPKLSKWDLLGVLARSVPAVFGRSEA